VKWQMRGMAGATLLGAVVLAWSPGQQAASERHIRDIEAEQTPAAILASPLCQKARESGQKIVYHNIKVDPASIAPDMRSLMEQSDDVVLAGGVTTFPAIAPSGEEAITYFDVKVLRVWKGPEQVGDKITFAIPDAVVLCGSANFATRTDVQYLNGEIEGSGLLFLRRSRGGEVLLTPGLRLAAGGGLQGLYIIDFPNPSNIRSICTGSENIDGDWFDRNMRECNAFLERSDIPIAIPYMRDPLFKKYNGMPVSEFLAKVQDVADSLAYAPPSKEPK
jgi:hypothetical protein